MHHKHTGNDNHKVARHQADGLCFHGVYLVRKTHPTRLLAEMSDLVRRLHCSIHTESCRVHSMHHKHTGNDNHKVA